MKINLGCGRFPKPGWINVDRSELPGVDLVFDLARAGSQPLPYADSSVDEFLMSHVLEHIAEPLPLLQELHRVAKPGARLEVLCPYGSSDDAWEDPTHARPYFLGSFGFFSQPFYWRADYGYRGDWQVRKIDLLLRRNQVFGLTQEELIHRVMTLRNVVVEMRAELEAVKPARPPQGDLQQKPALNFVMVG